MYDVEKIIGFLSDQDGTRTHVIYQTKSNEIYLPLDKTATYLLKTKNEYRGHINLKTTMQEAIMMGLLTENEIFPIDEEKPKTLNIF